MVKVKAFFSIVKRKFLCGLNYPLLGVALGFQYIFRFLYAISKFLKKGVAVAVFLFRFTLGCALMYPGKGALYGVTHYFGDAMLLSREGQSVIIISVITAIVSFILVLLLLRFAQGGVDAMEDWVTTRRRYRAKLEREIDLSKNILRFGSAENKLAHVMSTYRSSPYFMER